MQELEQPSVTKVNMSLPERIILVAIVGILFSFGLSLL